MVKKIYEQDIIDGIDSIGMVSIAYLDDLFKFYNEKRVFNEKLSETEFIIILDAMEKRGTVALSRGRDVQLGHKGVLSLYRFVINFLGGYKMVTIDTVRNTMTSWITYITFIYSRSHRSLMVCRFLVCLVTFRV